MRVVFRIVWSVGVLAGCGGDPSLDSPESASSSRRVIGLDEVSPRCETRAERAAWAPVDVEVVPDPVRPEAVGFFWRDCMPGEPIPDRMFALEAFVYDGRYVTLGVHPDRPELPAPFHRVSEGDVPRRLDASWRGDVLSVRLPDDRELEIGRFEGGRFVAPPDRYGERVYAPVPGPPIAIYRELAALHAPYDYLRQPLEDATRARIDRAIVDAIAHCATVVDGDARGVVSLTLREDGTLFDAPTVRMANTAFVACAETALAGFTVVDLHAATPRSHELSFGISR